MGGSAIGKLMRFGIRVAVLDLVVVAACVAVALVLGELTRTAVAMLTLLAGGIGLVLRPLAMGSLPFFPGANSDQGMLYNHVPHTDLLLQQELRDGTHPAGIRSRRAMGMTSLVSGVSLVFISLLIAG